MTEVAVVGIDIGKTSFHLIGLDVAGSIQWKKKLSRSQLIRHMAALPRCLVGIEACCGAHHLARELSALDHDVRLMAPLFVEAVPQIQQERLPRCRGDRRSRSATDNAVRTGQVC